MKKEAGLWIDHRKTVIVTIADEGEAIKLITVSFGRERIGDKIHSSF